VLPLFVSFLVLLGFVVFCLLGFVTFQTIYLASPVSWGVERRLPTEGRVGTMLRLKI